MNNARVTFLTVAAVVTALALSACAGGSPATPAASSSAPAAATFNSDDVMFAQLMIPHHEQAVQMSEDVLAKNGVDPAVIALATQIKDAQAPEITIMNGWLSDWNAAKNGMAGMKDGMMSPDDMKALQDASGADAQALYLTQMIMHHEGAIAMAQAELRDGKNADALALADGIVRSQGSEIAQMKNLLAPR